MKKFRDAALRGELLGLNDDELAFYDALANNEESVRTLGDETLAIIAHELTNNFMRKSVSVIGINAKSARQFTINGEAYFA